MTNTVEEKNKDQTASESKPRSLWQCFKDHLAEIMKPTDRPPTVDGLDRYMPLDHSSMAWRRYSGFHALERFY